MHEGCAIVGKKKKKIEKGIHPNTEPSISFNILYQTSLEFVPFRKQFLSQIWFNSIPRCTHWSKYIQDTQT